MSIKNEIIQILEKNRDTSISGQAIAKQLNVTRAAIWKGIKSLQEQGYNIKATTNKGYILEYNSDVLSAEGIRLSLDEKYKQSTITVLDTIDSTNTYAKNLAMSQKENYSIIVAREQTVGRGRQGRNFFSPRDTGIYMSLILRPNESLNQALLLTVAAALGVCFSIEKLTDNAPKIKWVNDIFVEGKKAGGILTEAISDFESGSVEAVIIGIGLNLKTELSAFPSDLRPIATSLFIEELTRNNFIGTIASEIFNLTENLQDSTMIEEYKNRSLVLGQNITYVKDGKTHHATTVDINNRGNLVVKSATGIEILQSGEISLGSENYCNDFRN